MTEPVFSFAAQQISRALGDTVIWKPGTPWEREIKAVYGNGFDQVQSGGVRLSSRRPDVTVALADLGEEVAEEGVELEARGVRYKIAQPESDVEAVSVRLLLKRA